MKNWLVVIFILVLSGCASFNPKEKVSSDIAQPSKQHVVLISLDGFRWDYIEKYQAKQLASIAEQGVRAEKLIPVYPTNTFPNHLSIVTGLHPGHHGIVGNKFYDSERNEYYKMGDGKSDSTWVEGIPLWNLAEMQGVKAASYFWPESDARINGRHPSYFYFYSHNASYSNRVDQIVQWLSLPEHQRPRLVTGYFSMADSIGHTYGPESAEIEEAVAYLDHLIGDLYRRLQALDIEVNLVLVSDHGMTEARMKDLLLVDELNIDPARFSLVNDGSHLMIHARQDTTEQQLAAEIERLSELAEKDYRFALVGDARRRTHAVDNTQRSGDILLEILPPSRFINQLKEGGRDVFGAHGYDPLHPDMGALFVAAGPAFKQGVQLGRLSNLAIYPMVARIMGLRLLSHIDGDDAAVLPALNLAPSTTSPGH